jgi:hypothetical protein
VKNKLEITVIGINLEVRGMACITNGEKINVYRILVGKPVGRPRRRWEHNIKMNHRKIGWGGMDWIDLTYNGDQWRTLVNAVMNLRVL